jgi:hypothetical protein
VPWRESFSRLGGRVDGNVPWRESFSRLGGRVAPFGPSRQQRLDALQGPPTEPAGWVPLERRFPGAAAARWPSPPAPLVFPVSGATFEALPRRTILCAAVGFFRPDDAARRPSCASLPALAPFHPGSVARCARASRSPAGAPAPDCARGTTPLASTSSRAGPCSRTPPRRWKPPPAGGETCIARALAHARALLPGRSSGCPAAGWVRRWDAAHRCASPVSLHRYLPGSRREPLLAAETSSSVRSLGAQADFTGARLPFSRPGLPPAGSSVPPDLHVPPAWFDPTSAACSARWFPGFCTWYRPWLRCRFRIPAPADRRWLPSCARGGPRGPFPQRRLTPLEEPASRPLAQSGREPRTRRTASPRPLPPCRFHDFEALLGPVEARVPPPSVAGLR